jgi:hypothetical protein
MSLPQYPMVLAQSVADSTAVANSTVAASLLHGSGKASIPPNALQTGSKLRLRLRGRISTLNPTPGTLTLTLLIGGVVVSSFGAITLNTVAAQTNATFDLEIDVVIRSVGSAAIATALATGRFTSRATLGSPAVAAGTPGTWLLPDTAPVVGTGFDSSATCAVDVQAQWSVASVSNSIQTHDSLTELKV